MSRYEFMRSINVRLGAFVRLASGLGMTRLIIGVLGQKRDFAEFGGHLVVRFEEPRTDGLAGYSGYWSGSLVRCYSLASLPSLPACLVGKSWNYYWY